MVLVVTLLPLWVVVAEEMEVVCPTYWSSTDHRLDIILLPVGEVDALHDLGIDHAVRSIGEALNRKAAVRGYRQCAVSNGAVGKDILGHHWVRRANGVGGHASGHLT